MADPTSNAKTQRAPVTTEQAPAPKTTSGDSRHADADVVVSSEINDQYGMSALWSGPMTTYLGQWLTGSADGSSAAPEVSIPQLEPAPSEAPPASTLQVAAGFEGDRTELQAMLDAIEDVSGVAGPPTLTLEKAVLYRGIIPPCLVPSPVEDYTDEKGSTAEPLDQTGVHLRDDRASPSGEGGMSRDLGLVPINATLGSGSTLSGLDFEMENPTYSDEEVLSFIDAMEADQWNTPPGDPSLLGSSLDFHPKQTDEDFMGQLDSILAGDFGNELKIRKDLKARAMVNGIARPHSIQCSL